MPFYSNRNREREATVLVPLTPKEAEMAVEALRHVGREIFEDQPGEEILCDASTAVAEALAKTRKQ
jgi:hypothetical protein